MTLGDPVSACPMPGAADEILNAAGSRAGSPLLGRAMVLADRALFVAGPPDLVDEEQAAIHLTDAKLQAKRAEQAAAMTGKRGGLLLAVSAANGEKLAEYQLDAPPVFDGMASAGGRLYLALQNGRVVCMAPK